jgi:hypothetical protein
LTSSTNGSTTTYSWRKSVGEEICNKDGTNPGSLAIPLIVFGPPNIVASQYPNANLHKEIIISYEELAACFHEAVRSYNMHKALQ